MLYIEQASTSMTRFPYIIHAVDVPIAGPFVTVVAKDQWVIKKKSDN